MSHVQYVPEAGPLKTDGVSMLLKTALPFSNNTLAFLLWRAHHIGVSVLLYIFIRCEDAKRQGTDVKKQRS